MAIRSSLKDKRQKIMAIRSAPNDRCQKVIAIRAPSLHSSDLMGGPHHYSSYIGHGVSNIWPRRHIDSSGQDDLLSCAFDLGEHIANL